MRHRRSRGTQPLSIGPPARERQASYEPGTEFGRQAPGSAPQSTRVENAVESWARREAPSSRKRLIFRELLRLSRGANRDARMRELRRKMGGCTPVDKWIKKSAISAG